MKWLNCYRIKLMLFVFVAAINFSVESANAGITISEPTNLGPVINDAGNVQECDFSADGLELYFCGSGGIQVATRETIESDWGEPVNLGPVINGPGGCCDPAISPNGLELYFDIWGDWYLRVAKRSSKDEPWGNPVKVGPPVGAHEAYTADVSGDGLSLYFSYFERPGGYGSDDIWVATRDTIDDEWGEPVNLGPNVNSSSSDTCPSISYDGLTLVFNRGIHDIWVTTRKSLNDNWDPAVKLNISGPGYLYGAALSPDGSTMYFDASAAWGGYGDDDIWQVNFIQDVDFKDDGIVDFDDLVIMIEKWGTSDSLCDIAPMPLGDGFVNKNDLQEFMNQWVEDYTFIAHYKFDEIDGTIAHDSTGGHDAYVFGDVIWHPDDGVIDGAIEFDGIDDYVSTPFVLNPEDGPLSIFAWIKGGLPGQVILSQADGTNWLSTDTEGNLMTELKGGRGACDLLSEEVVTDGNWHSVGFTWDDVNKIRTLYVDDVIAAIDTQPCLEGSYDGLFIGAGKDLEEGIFWSGLIDDVRIYNRVLTP